MRLGIIQNNTASFLGIFSIGFFIVLTMNMIPTFTSATTTTTMIMGEKTLRHVVMFKFKESTTEADLSAITASFAALPTKIPEIVDFEWGTNNSPEGLDKGFTHCFLVSFADEKGRDTYLPHVDHKAFVELASPHIEDVLVLDYWND